MDGYGEAAALAYDQRDRFALDFVAARPWRCCATSVPARAGRQGHRDRRAHRAAARPPARAATARATAPAEPAKVVLFSGHMIDDPKVRGPGAAKPARFPAAKADAAAAEIPAALDEIGAGAGDLGICGGACGGDLLFAQACLARGMRVELRLAQPQARFLRDSVTFADPDHRWERAFADVAAKAQAVLVMDESWGRRPRASTSTTAATAGCSTRPSPTACPRSRSSRLWDGDAGDGPGGTEHMANLVRDLTGRRPIVIDPKLRCRRRAQSGMRSTLPAEHDRLGPRGSRRSAARWRP